MLHECNRIVFWGTPEFAVPSFEALISAGYNVVAVVTNPDKPSGRKGVIASPAVKMAARKHNIPVFQPPSLKTASFKDEIPPADLFIVVSYGKIIPRDIVDLPKCGALNVHPSLLPRWRGPSPIQYSIIEGDDETGVTIIRMDEKMDHGPIVAVEKLKIKNPDIRYKELHDELARLSAKLIVEVLQKYLRGEIKPVSQDETAATYSRLITKEDGKIAWVDPADTISRRVRAFDCWPGSFSFWRRGRSRIRLNVLAAVPIECDSSHPPGFVMTDNNYRSMLVQCGKGCLKVLTIQPEGRTPLSVEEFLRGYRDIIGAIIE